MSSSQFAEGRVSPRYMLDTNICIYVMKRQPPEVATRLEQHFVGEVVMSAITLAELEYGLLKDTREARTDALALQGFLEIVPVYGFGAEAAKAYGAVRYADPDRRRNALDQLIAAHAISAQATLVTNNLVDFSRFEGLRLENWVDKGSSTAH